ncbi:MAG: MgtC/SapB family protein [Pseudomonadota bacterium]
MFDMVLMNTATPLPEIALRLLAACIAGLVLGLDREIRHHPAGLRTHMLVALGSALFALVSIELSVSLPESTEVSADPIRIVQALATAIAFLAAATIIQSGGTVKGLTTGVGLWLAGGLGVACGAGLFVIAGLGAGLALLVLLPLRWIERSVFQSAPKSEDADQS